MSLARAADYPCSLTFHLTRARSFMDDKQRSISASRLARIAQLIEHFYGNETGSTEIAVAVGLNFGSLEPLEA